MNFDYNDVDVAFLIDCVKKRPILYDKSDADYSNVVLRDQTWIDIAKEVSSTDLECKRKWNYLRGKYAREMKCQSAEASNSNRKIDTRSNNQKSPWPFLQNMSFLHGHCQKRIKTKIANDSGNKSTNNNQFLQNLTDNSFDGVFSTSHTTTSVPSSHHERDDSNCDRSNKTVEFFNQQYIPHSSSRDRITKNATTNTDSDLDQSTFIPIKRMRTMLEETLTDFLLNVTTKWDTKMVEKQLSATTTALSPSNKIIDSFTKFVASSLEDISGRKQNEAMLHITNYLLNIRNEEQS